MTLNCREGDLARIISTRDSRAHGSVDKIVRCVKFARNPVTGEPGWLIEPHFVSRYHGDLIVGIDDKTLRPIRPAGDDEPTQETRRLPADAAIVEFGADAAAIRREMELPA